MCSTNIRTGLRHRRNNPIFELTDSLGDGQVYPRNGGPFGLNGGFWYTRLRGPLRTDAFGSAAASGGHSAAAAARGSGDPDVRRWHGDPGDRRLSGSAATAAAAGSGTRARLIG